jgi:cellulose synthase operon protein C
VKGLLFRDGLTAGAQALALVLEGADHVFRRDAATYGITGLERVQLGAPTPLGRVYTSAARALGLTRTPFYQRRGSVAVSVSVALLSPPALLLNGEIVDESPELWFHMGAMLTAAMPEYALLFGSPESEARAVLRALVLAFGPPERQSHGGLTAFANLAEVLWESVPARSQRRLRELCDVPAELEYDAVLAGARRALRRAGLFVAGDLRVALRETCAEEGIDSDLLARQDGLSELCQASPHVRDLVSLATNPVYAESRWHARRRDQSFPSGGWQPS